MKEIKITPPEGYEIDREASTLECIKFKPVEKKNLTYREIQKRNTGKTQYYIDSLGFLSSVLLPEFSIFNIKRYLPNPETALKIEALCQLYIIAEWYNDGWIPNPNTNRKVYPMWNNGGNFLETVSSTGYLTTPAFKSEEILKAAYEANKEIFETALKP